MKYLRANGYKTYIVTGGGQDFVRVYSQKTYGIPPEQVVGTAGGTSFGYDKSGRPFLTKMPKLLLNDDAAGKPEGIHLVIGRRPAAAFGNSTGDRCRTMRNASTRTDPQPDCPPLRSARSRKRCTTKRRRMAGSSSA